MNRLFLSIGAGPGMGASTAGRFAREGFDLMLAARDVSKLEQLAESIRKQTGRSVENVTLDATDFRAVQDLAERFGSALTVVHYNAAAMQTTDVFETPMETIERNLRVDIAGALAAVKYFAPYMEERRKGTVLLTGGGFALSPNAEYLTLSIGKAGIRCMVEALFPQLAAQGIHIATLTVMRVVSPGSEDAMEAAEAFWKLYSQPEGQWEWEATLR
ncbi:MAG: SDR family NAD(P)-dependent oxidoreductase [Acidobacteriaceae bacterium]|nr:SDR family NAD(P)-dependent oxidoreductase [Acidobacteriaceae bacterium]